MWQLGDHRTIRGPMRSLRGWFLLYRHTLLSPENTFWRSLTVILQIVIFPIRNYIIEKWSRLKNICNFNTWVEYIVLQDLSHFYHNTNTQKQVRLLQHNTVRGLLLNSHRQDVPCISSNVSIKCKQHYQKKNRYCTIDYCIRIHSSYFNITLHLGTFMQ